MPKKKQKILIVEDESALRDLYQIKLEQTGFEVVVASDGQSGTSLAKLEQPDLILLDILMPEVDGYQLLAELKRDPKTKNATVIIFSNLSQKEEIEKGFELGAKDFIIKTSVTPSQLAEKVKQYLAI